MKSSRNLWPYGIIFTFVLFISCTVGLVVMACGHKSELVSSDYYEQEIRFQSHLERAARAQSLPALVSYQSETRQIRIELAQTAGADKANGQIHLYRPSSAGLDRHLNLDTDAHGIQLVEAANLQAGLWKVRLTWSAAGKDFFLERSINVNR
jgi:hypothetical protein